MSRPPTDKEISLKAIVFDRKHFADGIDPAPDHIVENHNRLKDDPKLLTRIVPRFISALAFFEGYTQACEDRTGERMFDLTALDNEKEAHRRTEAELGVMKDRLATNRVEVLQKLRNIQVEIAMISTLPHGRNMRDRAVETIKQVISEIANDPKNIGIVIKPPPSAAPLIVDPCVWEGEYNGLHCRVGRTGSVDLYVDGKWGNTGDAGTSICRRHAIIALVSRLDAYEKAIAPMREALTQSEAERLAMKEERDRALAQVRAWEARTGETQPRIVQAKLEKDKPSAVDELTTARNWFLDDEAGSFTAIKEDYPACARFIEVLIAATDKPTKPIANDELRIGIDDELAHAAADYLKKDSPPRSGWSIAEVRSAISTPYVERSIHADRVVAFVDGAIWQSSRMENVAGEDPPNVHELREERPVSIEEAIVWFDDATLDRIATTSGALSVKYIRALLSQITEKDKMAWLKSIEDEQASRDRTPLPSPIIFRDDNERDYWDSVSLTLARKQETTAQSVASSADELVEERRLRQPLPIKFANRVRDDLRKHNEGIPGFDVAVCYPDDTTEEIIVWFGPDRHRSSINPARCSGKTPEQVAQEIRDEVCSVATMVGSGKYIEGRDKPQSTEPSDALLLQAATYANDQLNVAQSPHSREIEEARVAFTRQKFGQWAGFVRAYIAGALAK